MRSQTTRLANAAQAIADARANSTDAASDTILGLTLRLPDPCECGCATALIGPRAGTHPASLICDSCQAHRGWLPHSIHGFISEIIAHFGRLTTPIIVRRGGGVCPPPSDSGPGRIRKLLPVAFGDGEDRTQGLLGDRAMIARESFPNHRASETFSFECNSLTRFADGTLAELFLSNAKAGLHNDSAAQDSAVVCSFALQYGVPLDVIRHALLGDSHGAASSPLGVALDKIAGNAGAR